MRKPRFTFIGAFHHVMNRGINKSTIFPLSSDKSFFISLLKQKASLLKIRIFAYSIMDNHYHIILQNSSDKLSDFMRQVNGIYATYFRKKYGGYGYVFQNRFKSTLIQNEIYIKTAISYTLLNPVRANIVNNPLDYEFSSANEYFNNNINPNEKISDTEFVEELFQTKSNYYYTLEVNTTLDEKTSKIGKFLGGSEFIENILDKYNRREQFEELTKQRRKDEYKFKGAEEVIFNFTKDNNINEKSLMQNKIWIKRLRARLLVLLREKSGMPYSKINLLPIFNIYALSTLRVIYSRFYSKM